MDNRETANCIKFLSASWPQKPIDTETAAIWGAELRRFQVADVMAALKGLLRTSRWRPSLAEIIEPLVASGPDESASEAFASVWKAIGRVGRSGRPELSERAARAVLHMGGWSAICATWTIDERNWHRKEFLKEFEELQVRDTRQNILALASPVGRPDGSDRRMID